MALRQESGVATVAPPLLHDSFRENSGPTLVTEDFDEDDFEDAEEELPSYSVDLMDLHAAFEDCEVAVRRFFNNDLEGAMIIMTPGCRKSLYHSLGAAIFEFIPAMLTFDSDQINRALNAIKVCVTLCNQLRRNSTLVDSIGTMIRRPNFSTYSDMEAHAELCYAEALLIQAAMTIMESEALAGLIKGTIKVKNCYNSYKDCSKILVKKTTWESEESKIHFQSGVRLGTATFNLMISLLPPKIISLLEFVGFSGNKVERKKKKPSCQNKCGTAPNKENLLLRAEVPTTQLYVSRVHHAFTAKDVVEYLHAKTGLYMRVERLESRHRTLGLADLEAGSQAPGLRSVLCDLTLLGYHLVICHFIGATGDIKLCERILHKEMKVYPDGVWFLLFKGRYELMQGNLRDSLVTYNRGVLCQEVWRQFRHVCYWEIMWVNALLMEWRQAADYSSKLIEESTWSKTIYSYMRGALLLQLGDQITREETQICTDLLRNASYYKQRIAGKSLPMEKFMIRRCARYQAQGQKLVLPGIELLCLWNMFGILAKNEKTAQFVLKLIESTRDRLDNGSNLWMVGYEADNKALVRFLHGSLLAAMGLPRLAIDTLDTVVQLKHEIKEDTFLLPYSLAETAMCYHQLGDDDRALQLLQDARKKYSGYSLESRLHFRIHSRVSMIKNNGSPSTGSLK